MCFSLSLFSPFLQVATIIPLIPTLGHSNLFLKVNGIVSTHLAWPSIDLKNISPKLELFWFDT
jgi:hypothetical protein